MSSGVVAAGEDVLGVSVPMLQMVGEHSEPCGATLEGLQLMPHSGATSESDRGVDARQAGRGPPRSSRWQRGQQVFAPQAASPARGDAGARFVQR